MYLARENSRESLSNLFYFNKQLMMDYLRIACMILSTIGTFMFMYAMWVNIEGKWYAQAYAMTLGIVIVLNIIIIPLYFILRFGFKL
jgi:membrane protein YdbS with pleckstrin-like domain